MPKFRQKSGLTDYALSCGYIQRAEFKDTEKDIRIDLWKEHSCYHVRAHDFQADERLAWESTDSLADARVLWRTIVRKYLGSRMTAIRADARYGVSLEMHGEPEPSYVARFCGEWIGRATTREGALIKCYQSYFDRMGAQNDPT